MTNAPEEARAQRRVALIIKAYPFGILAFSAVLNLVMGLNPVVIALPTDPSLFALAVSAVLLLVNHAWLMTATELTRLRFKLRATPEEWAASGKRSQDASEEGLRELERCHNAHRNATENTTHFVLLSLVFAVVSAPALSAQIWFLGFGAARLGHTYSYLTGKDGLRGVFMSLSLCATFGIASYLVMSFASGAR